MAFANVASQEYINTASVGLSNPISQSFTIPKLGWNSVGVVMAALQSAGGTTLVSSGVTWGGVTMTKTIPSSNAWSSAPRVMMWNLINPPNDGAQTIALSFSAPSIAIASTIHIVVAYCDAHVTIALDDTSEETGTVTQNPDIISTQATTNEIVFSISASDANAVGSPTTTGCTELQNHDSGGNCSIAAYSIPAGSGNATHQHNYSQSGTYAIISASFKEVTVPSHVASAVPPIAKKQRFRIHLVR